jgi:AbrB family looped-hinge helix DNA binding protein
MHPLAIIVIPSQVPRIALLAPLSKTCKTKPMSSSRLSTKGQLVIPAQLRKALNLRPGDKVEMKLEGRRLVLQRATPRAAGLRRGKFGRPVLVTSKGAPVMTTESVNALLEELP